MYTDNIYKLNGLNGLNIQSLITKTCNVRLKKTNSKYGVLASHTQKNKCKIPDGVERRPRENNEITRKISLNGTIIGPESN